MPLPFFHPTSTRQINSNLLPSTNSTETTFNFTIAPKPAMTLTFPPQTIHPRSNKRHRATGDIDDRGHSKIAVWAKQKAMGRNLLRKASILNRIRRQALRARDTAGGLERVLVEQEREQEHLYLATLTLQYGSHDTYIHERRGPSSMSLEVLDTHQQPKHPPPSPPKMYEASTSTRISPNDAFFERTPPSRTPHRSHLPLPPSPLGLSNYDAFDQEDDVPDRYAHLDDDETAGQSNVHGTATSICPKQSVYSDFSILDPDEPVLGDYDQIDEGADAIWPSMMDRWQRPAGISTTSRGVPPFAKPLTATTTTVIPSPNLVPSSTFQSPNFASLPLSPAPNPSFNPTHGANELGVLSRGIGRSAGGASSIVPHFQSEHEEERKRQRSVMFLQFG